MSSGACRLSRPRSPDGASRARDLGEAFIVIDHEHAHRRMLSLLRVAEMPTLVDVSSSLSTGGNCGVASAISSSAFNRASVERRRSAPPAGQACVTSRYPIPRTVSIQPGSCAPAAPVHRLLQLLLESRVVRPHARSSSSFRDTTSPGFAARM